MKKIKRAIHFDFHTVKGIVKMLPEFNAALFAQTLQDSRVDYINFCAACNNGYSYYPTRVGIKYPGLDFDLFGDVVRECHARGIGVTGYINVGINYERAVRYPNECRVDRDGRVLIPYDNLVHDCDRRPGNLFTQRMCTRNPAYRKYILQVVREIIEYDVDGLFFDGYYPEACYCEHCMQEMLCSGVDPACENEVIAFQREGLKSLAQEIRKAIAKGKHVFFNGLPPEDGYCTHAEIEALPAWTWLHYEFFPQHAAYLRNIYDERVYMTGRFQRDWGDFGGIRPRAALECDAFDALSHGYELSFGDHMHPVTGINTDMYSVIGDIYRKFEKAEKYIDGNTMFSEAAILCEDYADLDDVRHRGAWRMLSELQICCDCVSPHMDFEKYRLLIIPDRIEMTGKLANKLAAYINNGGKILSSGTAGTDRKGFIPQVYDFLEYCGEESSKRAYFRLKEGFGDYRDSSSAWAIYYYTRATGEIGGTAIRMKNKSGYEVATYTQALFGVLPAGIHGCHYTPPGEDTEFSAAAMNENVGHICFDVFSNYGTYFLQAHKALVRQMIDRLLPDRFLRSNTLPSTSRLSVSCGSGYDILFIKATYPEHRNFRAVIEEHNILCAGYSVDVHRKIKSARTIFGEQTIHIISKGEYTRIELPQIVGFEAVILEY